MYKIYFYKDAHDNEPVREYMDYLTSRRDKNSRIKANKIREYVKILSIHGKAAGEPYIKHLDGEIWELRPLDDRVLFAAWYGDSLVLLHHFQKKTQKTPRREIEQAKRELADLIKRGVKFDE